MLWIFEFFLIIIGGIIGGILFRWRGGGEPEGWGRFMPRPVDQILFSAPYIALAFVALDAWQAVILSIITVVMVSKGHGENMDLGDTDATGKPRKPEWYESLIIGLYGRISNYYYDAIGLAVSGLTYTMPIGLFMANPAYGFTFEGLILAFSGALKGPAYMLAFWKNKRHRRLIQAFDREIENVIRFDGRTSWGEFYTGLFLWPPAIWLLINML